MPNYYIGAVRVGIGCEEENGKLTYIDLPNTYGFKDRKLAEKLKFGDKLLLYVAPNWGFAAVMKVREGKVSIEDKDLLKDYPFRVNVEVLCEIKYKNLMPKWKDLWDKLYVYRGKKSNQAAVTLHNKKLIPIDEHDYELIAAAIYRGKAIEDSGKTNQGLSASEFVEEVRKLLRKYDEKG